MVQLSESSMEIVSHSFCMPVTLIINFSLFQYLTTIYYKRRKEIRGALLLACAFGGFVTLIPFSYPNEVAVGHLNDISETASVLTFLIQITIIGRDINKKVKIATLRYMTYASELLILAGLFVVAQNLFEVSCPDSSVGAMDGLDNIFENVALWFIFGFRFTILIMAKGYRFVLEQKKLEMLLYLLFATHEYPFQILEANTNVPWENVQALWNRLTLALCVGLTIQEKLRSNSSKLGSKMHTTNASMGPLVSKTLANVSTAVSVRSGSRQPWGRISSKLPLRSAVRPAVSVGPQKN
ncbi:hypothetical protein Gpo141_00009845 [Globisporangium polare]